MRFPIVFSTEPTRSTGGKTAGPLPVPVDWPAYSCQGNSFVLVAEQDVVPIAAQSVARQVKSDGLLVLQNSSTADVRIRLFEKDGSESDLCGNGILCVAYHLWRAHRSRRWAVEMASRVHQAIVRRDRVTARFDRLGNPARFVGPAASCVRSGDHVLKFTHHQDTLYFVNSGEPHLFLLAQDISRVDMRKYEGLISDPGIFPNGTNFSILTIDKPFRIRTFERGVNAFTKSCGTGSIAAAQLLVLLGAAHQTGYSFLSEGGVHEVTLDGTHAYLSGRVKREKPHVLTPCTVS